MKGTLTSSRDTFITCRLMPFDSNQHLAVTGSTWVVQIWTPPVLAFLSEVVHIKLSSTWLLCYSPGRQSPFMLPGPSHQASLRAHHLPVGVGVSLS